MITITQFKKRRLSIKTQQIVYDKHQEPLLILNLFSPKFNLTSGRQMKFVISIVLFRFVL